MSIVEPLSLPGPRSPSPPPRRTSCSSRRDPVPQRGREHRALRDAGRWTTLAEHGIAGEVIVADNGSERRQRRARERGRRARRPRAPPRLRQRLPGRLRAPPAADYIVMADADLTYDFGEIPRFVEELEDGADLVMGNRMDEHPARRDAVAAPLRRQPGPHRASSTSSSAPACATPTAACAPSAATCCRGSTCAPPAWSSPPRWSSARPRRSSTIRQLPIDYHPRGGESKLSSFRDGWRHLRFLLVHSADAPVRRSRARSLAAARRAGRARRR